MRAREKSAGKYSPADVELLLTYVANLRVDRLRKFLADSSLPKSGNKQTIVTRLKEAVDEQNLSYRHLIKLLDETEPWGKQHVFLLEANGADPSEWKDKDAVKHVLTEQGLEKLFNKRRSLLLPDKLKLSSFEWSKDRLRITGVERRRGYERIEDMDDEGEDPDGDPVLFKAYALRTTRGLVVFEWDLVANEAFVQVTQLPGDGDYAQAMDRLFALVSEWLPVAKFQLLDLRAAVVAFDRSARGGTGAVRAHRVELAAPDGRRITGTSASADQPLGGNDHIDTALENLADDGGTGHQGNFYLTPDAADPENPIEPGDDVHINIIGNRNRFNIMTPQTEDVVRYAIQTVRAACG